MVKHNPWMMSDQRHHVRHAGRSVDTATRTRGLSRCIHGESERGRSLHVRQSVLENATAQPRVFTLHDGLFGLFTHGRVFDCIIVDSVAPSICVEEVV